MLSKEKVILGVVICVLLFLCAYYLGIIKNANKQVRIVAYCESFEWKDNLRPQDDENWNADGIRLIGQTDFLCSEFLYLKPLVKKSLNGICHKEGSVYYTKTRVYKKFDSLVSCLESGGRLPYN